MRLSEHENVPDSDHGGLPRPTWTRGRSLQRHAGTLRCRIAHIRLARRGTWTRRAREGLFPDNRCRPFSIIIFSHGLGGSRDGYEYLGRHWASHGYISVHVQHLGSDDAVWRDSAGPGQAMKAATLNLQNSIARPRDVTFALDQLAKLNAEDGTLRGRLDLRRVGVAGHSFGAYTALAVAGQRSGPSERSLADDRVKAVITMSAPVPRHPTRRDYAPIHIPILHMTGTADDSPIGDTRARHRRVPFDSMSGPPQLLVTLNGGDHMVFAGVNDPRRNAAKGCHDEGLDPPKHHGVLGRVSSRRREGQSLTGRRRLRTGAG